MTILWNHTEEKKKLKAGEQKRYKWEDRSRHVPITEYSITKAEDASCWDILQPNVLVIDWLINSDLLVGSRRQHKQHRKSTSTSLQSGNFIQVRGAVIEEWPALKSQILVLVRTCKLPCPGYAPSERVLGWTIAPVDAPTPAQTCDVCLTTFRQLNKDRHSKSQRS